MNSFICHIHITSHIKDFFTYGPSDFTGQQDGMTSGVELSCEPYVPSGDDGPFAVSLGCDQPVLNSPVPPGEGYAFPFTSHCTATPAVGLIFECYDLDGGTVDFTPFLDSVATGDAIECASDPTYFFNVATTNFLAMEGGGVDANTAYFTVGSKTMNTDFAVNSSMFSSLVSEPSPAPTAIPTPSPTIKQSSANTMLGNGIRFFGLVLFSATLASISVLF